MYFFWSGSKGPFDGIGWGGDSGDGEGTGWDGLLNFHFIFQKTWG